MFLPVTLALLDGLWETLKIFLLTLAFSLPLGLAVAFGSMSRFAPLRLATRGFVWIIRGTPLMLQLIIFFYCPGMLFGLPNCGRFWTTILAFSINYACYFSEIYRGGIESIPLGQYEAGQVLGMTRRQIFFRIVLLLVLSITFMISMHPVLTLIALIPTPAIILYSFYFHRKIHDGFLECDENEGKLSAMAQENLTGVRVVRAFGRERAEIEKFEKQNDHYTALWEKMAKVLSRFWSVSDVLSGLQVMLVVVFGAFYCVNADLQAGAYIAFISYNAKLVWPIRQLGRMISEMSKAGVSIDRVAYIMHSPAERDDPEAEDAPMDGDITFEHVNFSYENSPEILHDINFNIKAGTTLGILGGTGSGKSTLMLLLDKLYPLEEENGTIAIGGKDIRKIRTAHLRKNIGFVLQEPYLFSRTIAENIAISNDEIDMLAVRSAAEAAALDETINGFAAGYETMVGERGVTLSGGQKQRAAIARTLVSQTPILIFDDSLSAVDTETDARIRRAISQRFGKATVILISHRITTLSAADKIIVLDKGRITEEGTHEELKNAGGIYQKIYEAQSGAGEVLM